MTHEHDVFRDGRWVRNTDTNDHRVVVVTSFAPDRFYVFCNTCGNSLGVYPTEKEANEALDNTPLQGSEHTPVLEGDNERTQFIHEGLRVVNAWVRYRWVHTNATGTDLFWMRLSRAVGDTSDLTLQTEQKVSEHSRKKWLFFTEHWTSTDWRALVVSRGNRKLLAIAILGSPYVGDAEVVWDYKNWKFADGRKVPLQEGLDEVVALLRG